MKRNIKAVFFDLDGVILDSDCLWNYIIEKIITQYNLKVEILKENDGYNLSTKEAIEMILKHSNRYSFALFSEIIEYIDSLYRSGFKEKTSLIKDILEVLQCLVDKNKKLILVSNSSKIQVDLIVQHYNLGKYFYSIITSDEVKKGKPDKEPYIKALQKSGFQKEEVLVVEDSLTGVTSAKNAGLSYIVVNQNKRTLLEYLKNIE